MDLLQGLTLLLILCASCLFLYLQLNRFWRYKNLPPGPAPLPLLGNILEIGIGGIVKSLIKLTDKYGDVFTIYLGSRPVVVVTGYKFVKEIFLDNGDDYLNRGEMPYLQPFYKNYGLAFTTNMKRWRELRRFSMPVLRDLGLGKRSTEDRIQEEIQFLVAKLKKTQESFIDPRHSFSKAVCNIIFSIMFGNHHKYEDKDIDTVLSCINEALVTMSSAWGQMYDMFPGLMRFIPGRHHNIYHLLKKLSQYVETRVQINLKSLDPENPRDYVDAFLIKMEKVIVPHLYNCTQTMCKRNFHLCSDDRYLQPYFTECAQSRLILKRYRNRPGKYLYGRPPIKNSDYSSWVCVNVKTWNSTPPLLMQNAQFSLQPPLEGADSTRMWAIQEKVNPHSEFNMKNLLANTLQIFFAAVETVSTTLTYSLLVLLKYPDVLAKVHDEIDQVIGRHRSPIMQDRNIMPYSEAMIYEMQRFIDLAPLGLPRKTIKEVKLKGYTLPKDTDVFPILTSVLKDQTCFKHPTEFNPDNFLNENGEFQKNNAFMPLGAGKRICLGESLVRMELFLFLTTILQNFNLKSPVPLEELDTTPNVSGLGNFPKPYKIAFIPR